MEPAKEFPAGAGLRGPRPELGELLVESKMKRDDLVPDFLAWGGLAAADVTHDLRVTVQVKEIPHIVPGEPAQRQALRFADDVHAAQYGLADCLAW